MFEQVARPAVPPGWSVILGKKRALHNLTGYLLSDIAPVGIPTKLSELSQKVSNELASSAGASWSSTLTVPKHPLRLIVARTPICESVWHGTHTTICYMDTLSCGHQVYAYPQTGEAGKTKRHRCSVCGEAQLAIKFPKKPAQSVPSSRKKGVA